MNNLHFKSKLRSHNISLCFNHKSMCAFLVFMLMNSKNNQNLLHNPWNYIFNYLFLVQKIFRLNVNHKQGNIYHSQFACYKTRNKLFFDYFMLAKEYLLNKHNYLMSCWHNQHQQKFKNSINYLLNHNDLLLNHSTHLLYQVYNMQLCLRPVSNQNLRWLN